MIKVIYLIWILVLPNGEANFSMAQQPSLEACQKAGNELNDYSVQLINEGKITTAYGKCEEQEVNTHVGTI